MPSAIGGSLTINFDVGVSSVTAFGTTITTSGNSIEDISADDGTTYTGTFVLNSGYAIDTIVYSDGAVGGGGTLSGYTDTDFSLVAGTSGIYGTLTITTKEATDPYSIKIKNKEGIKLLTKDKTIEFTDDVKITIDESLLGGGEEAGYTLTINKATKSGYSNDVSDSTYSGIAQYQINEDGVWHDFATLPLTLNNVKSIRFKCFKDSVYCGLHIGFGNNSYSQGSNYYRIDGSYALLFPPLTLTTDETIAIGATPATAGGGGA